MNIEEKVRSLEFQIEELRQKIEEVESKAITKKVSGGPPSTVEELTEKLDENKDIDAGVIIGSVLRTKYGTASSLSSVTGFESWMNLPDSYVAQVVQPFTDPRCLIILKTFLDGAEKTKEELQNASGVSKEDLDKLLTILTELRYIEWNTKQTVENGHTVPQDVFSLEQRGRSLLLAILYYAYYANEQKKHSEVSMTHE